MLYVTAWLVLGIPQCGLVLAWLSVALGLGGLEICCKIGVSQQEKR